MISPEQVGERYLALHHRMHRAFDDQMCRCGLSLARTKVLSRLRQGPVRQNVLAVELGVSPHTVTDIVDGLERDGLAERQSDPADRRAKLVAMTSAGQAALTVAAATRERLLRQVFGVLSPQDTEALIRVIAALEAATAALPGCALAGQAGQAGG
jgi:DNA-binding MarR family transcriptional regulator